MLNDSQRPDKSRRPHPNARTTVPIPPISLATRSFRRPLKAALQMAADLGADGVEIDLRNELRISEFSQTGLRQFRKLLDDLGLRVLAASFPTRRGFDDPNDLERRILATREAMTFAYKIGARIVVGQAGESPTDPEEDPSATLIESLQLLGAHGEHAGARFALLSDAVPSMQCRLLDRVASGTVGVALHPGLLIRAGADTAQAATELASSTLHLYAADAVRDASVTGGATEVQLGRGEADLPAILAVLEERGYTGPVSIDRQNSSDPLTEIGDAVAYLRELGN